MADQPNFLTPEQVLSLHRRTIAAHGGDPGLRDPGLLDSALAQPMVLFAGEFLHRDFAEMAGAYLFHLAMNHAFVEGNKRIAAAASLTFLAMNGILLDIDEHQFEALVLAVASGERSKGQVTDFFRHQ